MRLPAWLVDPQVWRVKRKAVAARPVAVGCWRRGRWGPERGRLRCRPLLRRATIGAGSAGGDSRFAAVPSALQPEAKREPKPDWAACRLARTCTKECRPQGAAAQGSARRPECLRAASGLHKRSRIGEHAIDPHRIGDVLDMAISERLVSANQLVLYLFVDAAGDVDVAGWAMPSSRVAILTPSP